MEMNDNAESFESFDSFENIDEDSQEAGGEDDWTGEEKVKDEGMKVLKDSEADIEGKVIKEDGEKKPKKEEKEDEEDEEEESEEEEVEEKEEETEEEKEEKKESKKLRIKMGDGLYNVESDATLKVKVDGQLIDVPLQELVNNYSGKTAWDKKFTEIGKEKKVLESEKAQINTQRQNLLDHLNTALAPIKDLSKNPIDSLMYLVEMSGEDPYTAYRRIMESNLDELSDLMDMSETERELYFHKKKDELYSNVNRKRQERYQKETAFKQALDKVESLRNSHNVSEEDFITASDELHDLYQNSGLDVKTITNEAVVDYASLKPHITLVQELVEPYKDNISEDRVGEVIGEFSRSLRDKKISEKQIKEILKRNFSVEEEVKELNTRVYQKSEKVNGKKVTLKDKAPKDWESFDDI